MDAFLFYAYWNGEQMRDLFEALASVTSRGSFAQMAALFFLLGIVIVLAVCATRNEGRPAISYFACALLFWFVCVVPRVTVAIEDIRSQSVYTVDNVPLGIGVFGSIANRAGYWLTELYESAFTPVDVARFSKFGAVYPERILEVLQSLGPVTVEGSEAVKSVVEGCVVPELLSDQAKAVRLASAVDLWKEISTSGWVNPARLVAMPEGEVMKCPEAIEYADNVLRTVELPALKARLGARLAPEHPQPGAVVAASIPKAEELLLNLSRTMDATLKHSLLLTAVPQALAGAADAGPLASAVELARAQGNLASEINYRTMARIAQDALPKVRNALEFVVIGMFPVIVLVALVAGSSMGAIVRSYLTILVTIQIWPALSSVVNYLMITWDAHPFGALAQEFGGNSLQAASLVRETGATSQAIAGALMCAVPVIAYALVRAGDMAVGQLVGGLTAPAQSAASSQGAALAAGNISQGNVQLSNVSSNTTTANKFDRSIAVADSGSLVSTSAYGTVTRAGDGTVTGMRRTPIELGVTATTTQSFARAHASTNLSQVTSLWSDAARFSFTQAAASTDATQRGFAHALRQAMQSEMGYATTHASSERMSTSAGVSRAVDMSSSDSVSEGTSVSSGGELRGTASVENIPTQRTAPDNENMLPYSLGVIGNKKDAVQGQGVSAPAGRSVSSAKGGLAPLRTLTGQVSTDLTLNDAQSIVDVATNRTATSQGSERSTAYDLVRNAAERVASTHGDESVRSAARSFASSLSELNSSARDESRAVTGSLTASSTVNQNVGAQATTSVDGSVSLMNEAIGRFETPEAAMRRMFDSRVAGEALGADASFSQRFEATPKAAFGPGTIVSAREMNQGVLEQAQADLARSAGEYSARVPRSLDAVDAGETGAAGAVEAEVSAHQQAVSSNMQRAGANIDFERGVLLVAQDAYRKENDDKNFALRNAFLFAWGYRSGGEIQDDMRARSEEMPQLKEMLERIGRSSKDELDEKDWRGLVELARQPRGLRP